MGDIPRDLVAWVLAYDGPAGHLLPAPTAEGRLAPCQGLLMIRFGVWAHDFYQLSGFLQFLQRPTASATKKLKSLVKVLPVVQPAVQRRRNSAVDETASKIEDMQLRCKAWKTV